MGKVLQVADSEDDGTGGEFLRVWINLDILRPLPRRCMLWVEQKLVGWVGSFLIFAIAVIELVIANRPKTY